MKNPTAQGWRKRLARELAHYENLWVAIDTKAEKVVGSGADALEARREAEGNGCPEATLFKVPPSDKKFA